jgi:hypothetical protein
VVAGRWGTESGPYRGAKTSVANLVLHGLPEACRPRLRHAADFRGSRERAENEGRPELFGRAHRPRGDGEAKLGNAVRRQVGSRQRRLRDGLVRMHRCEFLSDLPRIVRVLSVIKRRRDECLLPSVSLKPCVAYRLATAMMRYSRRSNTCVRNCCGCSPTAPI